VEYLPAAQTHALRRLFPAGDVLPAGQSRHTVDEVAPTVVEYLPAAQSAQTLAVVVAEYLPAAQSVHAVLEFKVVENFPAGHARQISQVYMIFLQTLLLFKLSVQPDRYPPWFKSKNQDNRFSQVPVLVS